MPCVQAEARRAHAEYVRRNRREVNEFEGVTDLAETLAIVHRARPFDELVHWIPHPVPVDVLYTRLNADEQHRLALHAESLIGTARNDEAQDIVRCLAAFTEAPLADCLRAFVELGADWPELAFLRASADTRDELIKRVDIDDAHRDAILASLAWLGDEVVLNLFERWRKDPPAWKDKLYLPPHDYARVAGWELAEDGRRRELFFRRCTGLTKGGSTAPERFLAVADAEGRCGTCGARLTHLLDLKPAAFGVLEGARVDALQVSTCEACTTQGTVFGRFDERGAGRCLLAGPAPQDLSRAEAWDLLPRDSLTPSGARPAFFAADPSLPTTFSQIGGHPAWIQDACYPACPQCARTMMFLAQCDVADIEDHGEGLYYAFVCPGCRTTATMFQQT